MKLPAPASLAFARTFSRALTTTLVIGLMIATVAATTRSGAEPRPADLKISTMVGGRVQGVLKTATPGAAQNPAQPSEAAPTLADVELAQASLDLEKNHPLAEEAAPSGTRAAIAAETRATPGRYKTVEHTIKAGETASEALSAMKAPADALLRAAGSSLNRVREGDILALDYVTGEKQPFRLRFITDAPVVRTLEWNGSKYVAHNYPVPYQVEPSVASMVIESSLWAAGEAVGLTASQIMSIAGIFETEVDFNTELTTGARIKLVADKLTDEVGHIRYGDIRGARLVNGKRNLTFIRFVGSDGKVGWYAPEGEGKKRPFLRSPLEFSRVTSTFSRGRYHPLLKETRPHYGVDLGAPMGTPIRAVADGVVVASEPHGGHGNYVELKHEGPYGTSYSHLSAILVRRGQKVKQGDIVGRVGSTGLSTGPHLHYQMTINGNYVDPMTTVLPMTGGLSVADKAAFHAVRDEVMALLKD